MAVLDPSVRSDLYARVRARWQAMAEQVREFEPTVVVLVARKAPRVVQALDLDLGFTPLLIADTGLEFVSDRLRGARVAIIDDIVNVGSTLSNARAMVEDFGAAEIGVFALARRVTSDLSAQGYHLIDERPLDHAALEHLTTEIPALLHSEALPYDLDFPIIETRLTVAKEAFATAQAVLTSEYGQDAVYDISSDDGGLQGIRRLVVALPTASTPHRKVRMYIDEKTGVCNVVPMCLASPLRTDSPPAGSWQRKAWNLVGAEERSEQARAYLNLFLDSLALGLSFVHSRADLLSPSEHAFDADQASLTFGPRIRGAADLISAWEIDSPVTVDSVVEPPVSAFLAAAREHGLVDAVREHMAGADDALTAFVSFFHVLAEWAGANDPDRYRLQWPFTREQILAKPYLRLRIGPTFGDLAAIIAEVTGIAPVAAAMNVSKLMDRYIDDGGVVPTIATYDGHVYRVYRKGEKDPRDEVALRLCRAWYAHQQPLSLTRATKLAVILAFSEDRRRSDITIRTEPRGSVACYPSSVLNEETEVTHQLLRTGRLELQSDG